MLLLFPQELGNPGTVLKTLLSKDLIGLVVAAEDSLLTDGVLFVFSDILFFHSYVIEVYNKKTHQQQVAEHT